MTKFPLAQEQDKGYNIKMFRILFNRFFPNFNFSKSSIGLDISDESVKFIELIKTKNSIRISRYGERKIPLGVIKAGKIVDQEWLEQILMLLRKEEGIKSAHISLPCELLDKNEQNLEIEISDMLESVIGEYLSAFRNSNIYTKSLEFEAKAISQSIIKKGDRDTYMIVDFGQKRTGIFIVSSGVLVFTSVLEFSGKELTNLIKEKLNVSFVEAEKMKKESGLKRNSTNTELSKILLNGFSILRDEINKHFVYWHLYKNENGKENPPISKIILCGSDSNIAGLSEYLSVAMRNKVELANVWTNVLDTDKLIPEINFEESFMFAPALGIALNGFKKK